MNTKTKIIWIVFYILVIFAIGIMVLEYFEIKEYISVCKDYYNRTQITEINVSSIFNEVSK